MTKDNRRIKLYIDTGFANASHVDYIDLPDGWDRMSDEDQEEYLEQEAQDFLGNHIGFGADVVAEENDEG
jgi:hypothetical protein